MRPLRHKLVAIGNDGSDNVKAIGQLKGFSHHLLPRHPAVKIGSHELSQCFVPQSAEWRTTVDAQVCPFRNDHRPRVDVDAIALEPLPELLCLREQVVLDQLAFEPGKGGEVTVTVAEVERQPRPGIRSKTCSSRALEVR